MDGTGDPIIEQCEAVRPKTAEKNRKIVKSTSAQSVDDNYEVYLVPGIPYEQMASTYHSYSVLIGLRPLLRY